MEASKGLGDIEATFMYITVLQYLAITSEEKDQLRDVIDCLS